MVSYHGTDNNSAEIIKSGNIDTNSGGGELGNGFYSGQFLWEAKSWAKQKHNSKSVVSLETNDDIVMELNINFLNYSEASSLSNYIKRSGQTKSYKADVDLIWSPIVGSQRCKGEQHKWESNISETLLNGENTNRLII